MRHPLRKTMSRDWFMFFLVVLFSLSTSGCISEQQKFHYSIDDSDKESNSELTNDVLFTLTLEEKGGARMDISELKIVLTQDTNAYPCSASGDEGDCSILQPFGTDNSSWEIGETLSVAENGVDICSQNCILTFTISGPEGSKIVGPTILNTS